MPSLSLPDLRFRGHAVAGEAVSLAVPERSAPSPGGSGTSRGKQGEGSPSLPASTGKILQLLPAPAGAAPERLTFLQGVAAGGVEECVLPQPSRTVRFELQINRGVERAEKVSETTALISPQKNPEHRGAYWSRSGSELPNGLRARANSGSPAGAVAAPDAASGRCRSFWDVPGAGAGLHLFTR